MLLWHGLWWQLWLWTWYLSFTQMGRITDKERFPKGACRTFHWPELICMPRASCEGRWGIQSLFQAVLDPLETKDSLVRIQEDAMCLGGQGAVFSTFLLYPNHKHVPFCDSSAHHHLPAMLPDDIRCLSMLPTLSPPTPPNSVPITNQNSAHPR